MHSPTSAVHHAALDTIHSRPSEDAIESSEEGSPMKTWLNFAEAAGYAGVGRDTLYTVCERGDVPYAPLRGRRAIHQRRWIVGSREQHIRGGRTDANTRPRPSALAQFADGRNGADDGAQRRHCRNWSESSVDVPAATRVLRWLLNTSAITSTSRISLKTLPRWQTYHRTGSRRCCRN
jgi:hypothetical protein